VLARSAAGAQPIRGWKVQERWLSSSGYEGNFVIGTHTANFFFSVGVGCVLSFVASSYRLLLSNKQYFEVVLHNIAQ